MQNTFSLSCTTFDYFTHIKSTFRLKSVKSKAVCVTLTVYSFNANTNYIARRHGRFQLDVKENFLAISFLKHWNQ